MPKAINFPSMAARFAKTGTSNCSVRGIEGGFPFYGWFWRPYRCQQANNYATEGCRFGGCHSHLLNE